MHKFVVILKDHTNIAKNFTQLLVMSTESNINVMGLKMFLDTILLLKRLQFEGINAWFENASIHKKYDQNY